MKLKPLSDRVIVKMVEAEEDDEERHHPHRRREGEAADR